jgi:hypothetical protein
MGEWKYCYVILDVDIRWKWMVSFMLRPLYPRGKSPWNQLDRRSGRLQRRTGSCELEKNLLPLPRIEHRLSCPSSYYVANAILMLSLIITCNLVYGFKHWTCILELYTVDYESVLLAAVRDSTIGIATGSGLGERWIGIPFPEGARDLSVPHSVQTGSGAPPVSYKMGTVDCGRGVKFTIHLHLLPRYEWWSYISTAHTPSCHGAYLI